MQRMYWNPNLLVTAVSGLLLMLLHPVLVLAAGPAPGAEDGPMDRPAWERVDGGTRLHGRDVLADPALPLPAAGESFYLFVDAALDNDHLATFADRGLRYLGLQDRRTYVFLVATDDPVGQRNTLGAMPQILGTASVLAADRLMPEVAAIVTAEDTATEDTAAEDVAALDVEITFWPETTVAELQAVVGTSATAGLLLPSVDTARVGPWRHVSRPGADAMVVDTLATSPFVAAIHRRGTVVGLNQGSRQMSGADLVRAVPYELTGDGVRVGIYDVGTLHPHPDFDMSRVLIQSGDSAEHGTQVTGTLFGSGLNDPRACGYAPEAELLSVSISNSGSNTLEHERRNNRRSLYHAVDNHSWTADPVPSNSYNLEAELFDMDARDYLLLGVKAAGNFGAPNTPRSLHADSTLKNNVVVGGVVLGGMPWPETAWGPTQDGRLKPDVMAKSGGVYTTTRDNGYAWVSGTSFAAPAVTGMVVLLEQLYRREHDGLRMAPDLVRTLLTHSAQDITLTGPDYRTGWGIADVEAAADLILADVAGPGRHIVRGAVREGETWTISTLDVAAGSGPLTVTLGWLDPMGSATALGQLVHNLDLELVAPNGMRYGPWRLNPGQPFASAVQSSGFGKIIPNHRDNTEQVWIAAPAAGLWQVRVAGTEVGDPAVPVQGFVVASSHGLDQTYTRAVADIPLLVNPLDQTVEGVVIPDDDPTGVEIPLPIAGFGTVTAARLYLDISHFRRGDLEIDLIAPGGAPTVRLAEVNSFTAGPLFALFPDLHSPHGDFDILTGLNGAGTWTLRLRDRTSGFPGSVLMAALELDGVEPNAPPVAAAVAMPTSATTGQTVSLDATMSSDPDGDPLSYLWIQQAGPGVSLSNPATAVAQLTAPTVASSTVLSFEVTVEDGRGGVDSTGVDLTVNPNAPPVATATFVSRVDRGLVELNGSASIDPEGAALTYHWRPLDIEFAIFNHTLPNAFFYAPTPNVPYRVELEVTDPLGANGTAVITFDCTNLPCSEAND